MKILIVLTSYDESGDTGEKQGFGLEKEQHFEHAARQSYVSLGFAMIAAALVKIDSTPMGGFDNEALNQLLELNKKGLKVPVFLLWDIEIQKKISW